MIIIMMMIIIIIHHYNNNIIIIIIIIDLLHNSCLIRSKLQFRLLLLLNAKLVSL